MNWWAIGGLLCILYTLVVGGFALNRAPWLIKIVKLKLGKKMSDETARTITLVFAGIVGVAGVVLFIIALTVK